MSHHAGTKAASRVDGQAFKEDLERVGETAIDVKDTIGKLGHDVADTARSGLTAAKQTVTNTVSSTIDAAKQTRDDAIESVTKTVSNRPLTSLAVALGVGVLLGAIVARSRA